MTNAVGLSWLSHDRLAARFSDVVHVQLLRCGGGATGVDYTVNARVGFPLVIGYVFPAWGYLLWHLHCAGSRGHCPPP